ncbi:MAG: DUF3536 domain-containing protein [Spirochaetales bacterium]|nr:DUF3536 domain-containing protein [Spirochaetales bacterium]
MKNKLIIHGHFYQPPREDPWFGLIPHQDSALPYHDWNERITKECYAANSMSRTLNPFGQITDIVNNYRFMSFNFGPTLLSWLKDNANYVYKNIIEADKISRDLNGGHGNAIAQGYNHTILPLNSNEDIKTQVTWGLQDFEYHYGRKAEGMWLPETGVNLNVVDILIEEGVNFILLSPWQAEAVCPAGSNKWQSLHNNPIPSGKAYRIERPHGSINVFFYNHILATGISFQHYLRNAERLYNHIVSFKQNADPGHLINIATDGEVYGHHEPFGDMCLAALTKLVKAGPDFEFTNYGYYLEQYPPGHLVKLKEGEKNLGTSWSCVHGVARWYRNCGCTTGGPPEWNQEWRTPLRDAFIYLRDRLRGIYIKEMSQLSQKDPMQIRNAYIDVLSHHVDRLEFARSIIDRAKPEDTGVMNKFYTLLEGQKYSMYMFTSCGWFFSEISGLEAMQNLRYAIRALELYSGFAEQDILTPFLAELENARSNIHNYGSGRNIIETMIMPYKKKLHHGAAILILSYLCLGTQYKKETYGIFKKLDFKVDSKTDSKPSFPEHIGEITVMDITTFNTATYHFTLSESALEGITLILKKKKPDNSYENQIEIFPGELPIQLRTHITSTISTHVVDSCITESEKSLQLTMDALIYLKKMHVLRPKTIIELAELLIDRIFEKILNDPTIIPPESELKQVKELVTFTKEYELNVDIESLKKKISGMIIYQTDRLTEEIEEETTKVIIHLLETSREIGTEPETTRAQDKIFQLLKGSKKYSLKKIEKDKDFIVFNRLRRLIKLGSYIGFDVEEYKDQFFNIE